MGSFPVAEVDRLLSSGHSKLHLYFQTCMLFTKKYIGAEKSAQLKTNLPTCFERYTLNSLRTQMVRLIIGTGGRGGQGGVGQRIRDEILVVQVRVFYPQSGARENDLI